MRSTPAHLDDASVAIVIVNWNGQEWLEACLSGVLAQEYDAPYEVILVDNCSSDDSVEFVRQRFETVRVLENHTNNYAAANNLGVASSASEFIVCLNTDTQVPRDWLSQLMEPLRAHEGLGGVTPLILFEDGRVNSTGIETLAGLRWRDRDFGRPSAEGLEAGLVDGISGCSAAWRRSCWEQVGGLDEDFHMYYEDVDMSLRVRREGWRLWFTPASTVQHAYNASIAKRERSEAEGRAQGSAEGALKDRLGERNRLYVIARHFPELLVDCLASSRFLLRDEEARVQDGLARIFAKWERDEVSEVARRELAKLGAHMRRIILEREAWALGGEVELKARDQKVRELRRHEAAMSATHEAERRSWAARVQRLEAQLHDLLHVRTRAESEALELRGRIVDQACAYEAQGQRDRDALRTASAAYEREIAHREAIIAELRHRAEESPR